jgi:aryl-alcohol dehydrogenase-like predicted oxidoreductase
MSTILRLGVRADAQSCDARHDGVREQDRRSRGRQGRQALDCGVSVFDTANVYASG